jgi:hypothetical protein
MEHDELPPFLDGSDAEQAKPYPHYPKVCTCPWCVPATPRYIPQHPGYASYWEPNDQMQYLRFPDPEHAVPWDRLIDRATD